MSTMNISAQVELSLYRIITVSGEGPPANNAGANIPNTDELRVFQITLPFSELNPINSAQAFVQSIAISKGWLVANPADPTADAGARP
jgi:hypothetical protein